MTSEWPQCLHSKVRRSWSDSWAGSMRERAVGNPHFEHGGRYISIGLTGCGSGELMANVPARLWQRHRSTLRNSMSVRCPTLAKITAGKDENYEVSKDIRLRLVCFAHSAIKPLPIRSDRRCTSCSRSGNDHLADIQDTAHFPVNPRNRPTASALGIPLAACHPPVSPQPPAGSERTLTSDLSRRARSRRLFFCHRIHDRTSVAFAP
jgi:hypothetical protein